MTPNMMYCNELNFEVMFISLNRFGKSFLNSKFFERIKWHFLWDWFIDSIHSGNEWRKIWWEKYFAKIKQMMITSIGSVIQLSITKVHIKWIEWVNHNLLTGCSYTAYDNVSLYDQQSGENPIKSEQHRYRIIIANIETANWSLNYY